MRPRKIPPQRFCDETTLAMIVDFAAMHLDAAEKCAAELRAESPVTVMVSADEAKSINLRRALRGLARFRHCEKRAQLVIARLERKARR